MRNPAPLSPSASSPGVLTRYRAAHLLPGRLRLRPTGPRVNAEALAKAVAALPAEGLNIHLSARTGAILITAFEPQAFEYILEHLRGFHGLKLPTVPTIFSKAAGTSAPAPAAAQEPRNPLPTKMMTMVAPRFVGTTLAILNSLPYIFTGLKALFRGKLNMETLDASALLVCLLRRDFKSLGSITFFFALGEYLAAKTRKQSRAGLADSLALAVEAVWIREGDLERQIPFRELAVGQHVVFRAGSAIVADGTVVDGDGMVNEASLTGEPLAVHRAKGATVYAGSVLEEGELVVEVRGVGGETRIQAVLQTIEESESAKALVQGRYERLADAIVPYNFLLAGLVFLLTRNPMRAGSVLLVDYSCAVRLAAPLTIFTAMREAVDHGVLIKGGRFLEAALRADVVVFDKTGTLTRAQPELVEVIAFGAFERTQVLRLAACLEEHFAHPVGRAVVYAADQEKLSHREEHAKVEYVAAHGIASHLGDQRVLLGSAHFVLEDEKITLTAKQHKIAEAEAAKGLSVLYLAVGGKAAGILLIKDEVRPEARTIVQNLRNDGIGRVIMLTGDGEATAKAVADEVGITEYRARLLPADKAKIIQELKAAGHTVMMVGDGLNDAPALSTAHVGVALKSGTDIAGEVADIMLLHDNLEGLLLARDLARTAFSRIHGNFRRSLLWNSAFLLGGLFGLLTPGISAFLHNAATAAGAVAGIQPMLEAGPAAPGKEDSCSRVL